MHNPETPLGTTTDEQRDSERAVTEVIAFILIFATVIGSVAVLYTTGFQAMTDYQENEQLNNAERGMTSLADNFNDVVRYAGVEQRFGELTLRDGTIRVGGESTTIEVDNGSTDREIELGSLTYEAGSDTIAYEGGGVFRADGEGSAVIKQPPIRCGESTVVVSILKLQDEGERSFQSDGGVGLQMAKTGDTERITDGGSTVTITVENPSETPYDNGWEQALTSNDWEKTGSSNEYECTGVENIEIQIVTAEIRL